MNIKVNMNSKIYILLLNIAIIFVNNVKSDDTLIHTTSGSVRGISIEVFNKSVEQYLGIPYAEPPLGSLRFAKPVPIGKPNKVNYFIERIIVSLKLIEFKGYNRCNKTKVLLYAEVLKFCWKCHNK